mgnify:CR=1 FL=1
MALQLQFKHIKKMDAYCRTRAPEEACGIIAGLDNIVASIHPAENNMHSPVEYRVNPADQIRIFNEIYGRDLDDIGYFHSHPVSEPFPSLTDIREVHIGPVRLVILSLRGPNPEVRSFWVDEGKVQEEGIKIVAEE